jgi:DNA-binding NarL/FixJ family response regulator
MIDPIASQTVARAATEAAPLAASQGPTAQTQAKAAAAVSAPVQARIAAPAAQPAQAPSAREAAVTVELSDQAQAKALKTQGYSIAEISTKLGLDEKTVDSYVNVTA